MRGPSLIVGLLSLMSVPVMAQSAPALRGTVQDSAGRPLSRVEVSYRDVRTLSDTGGRFRLSPVPLGRITVRFVRDGKLIGEVEANVTSDTTSGVQVSQLARSEALGSLGGTVVDEQGQPLRDVAVDVVSALRETRTDSLGRFMVAELAARRHLLRVRRVGYSPTYLFAETSDSGSTRVRIVVRQFAGQNLGLVVVRADRVPLRLSGFLTRAARNSGFGRIITEQQIAARNAIRPSDLFQAIAGVRVARTAFGSGVLLGRGNCRLALFINGQFIPTGFGMGVDELVSVQDLAGAEVYTGIGGIPTELMSAGTNSCGAVGLWTK